MIRVGVWLMFNAKLAIFSSIMARTWWNDDYDVRFVLDHIFDCAKSMNQQSSGRQVVTLGNIILFFSQPFFALTLSAVCLAEKQQIPLL
jgi:hypothetical protein